MKKIILAAFFCVCTFSCSQKVSPIIGIPPAPAQSQSARPNVEKTQERIDKSLNNNTSIQKNLKEQNDALLQQKINISAALAQAEKMKERALAKQAITELEAEKHITEIKAMESRNLFLEGINKTMADTVVEQASELQSAKQENSKARELLILSDNEKLALREQNLFLSKSLELKNKEVVDLSEENNKINQKLANAKVYKGWIIGGASLLLVGGVVFVLLKIYRPF